MLPQENGDFMVETDVREAAGVLENCVRNLSFVVWYAQDYNSYVKVDKFSPIDALL